jgi:hypothetical protein
MGVSSPLSVVAPTPAGVTAQPGVSVKCELKDRMIADKNIALSKRNTEIRDLRDQLRRGNGGFRGGRGGRDGRGGGAGVKRPREGAGGESADAAAAAPAGNGG